MARLTNWQYLRHRWQESGFSLIEVLASVIIVAIAMAALAPALTLVAYRRAMSERVEVANQLAQAEVDRIRTLVDLELAANPIAFQDPIQLARLPKIGADPLDSTPPPASMDTDGGNYSIRLAQIQLPGRNPEEYVIQSFRNAGDDCIDRRTNTRIAGVPCTFLMGVRAYHRFSFDQGSRQALPGLQTTSVSANQNLADANVWLFPMASSLVEINLAASLGDVCRGVLATTANPTNNCDAFPVPNP
ncbi:MAG: prepilin-type N-terminal cleavage/methylation domain-containing protein [Thermostichus sp. DG02_5_bins_236]